MVTKTEDGRYVLKYKGETREVDEDALFQQAQKAEGAERRMQEAAETEKKAADTLNEMRKVMHGAQNGDVEAYKKYLDFMEIADVDQKVLLKQYVSGVEEPEEDPEEEPEETPKPPKGKGKKGKQTVPEDEGEIPFERLPKEMQAMYRMMEETIGSEQNQRYFQRALESERDKDKDGIYRETLEAVESDAHLGKILKKGDLHADKLKAAAKRLIRGRIRDRDEPYGSEMRQKVVKDLNEMRELFGPSASEGISPVGLPGSPQLSHLDAQAGDEPIKPKDITDGDYNQNVAQRLFQKMRGK
jgi:hypothetical protein